MIPPGTLPGEEATPPPAPQRLRVAVVLHLYYPLLWPEFAAHIRNVPQPFTLFVTLPDSSPAEPDVLADFPEAIIRRVDNVGRDVAPFLSLYPELAAFDVVCKVHTKRDTPIHREWRILNLRNLLGSRALVEEVLAAFAERPDLLMAGPRDLYLDGARHSKESAKLQRELYGPLPRRYGYFAGTMFWTRPSIFADFATRYPHSMYVQHNDADGHPEHALERLFGARIADLHGKVALVDIDRTPAVDIPEGHGANAGEWPPVVRDRIVGMYQDYPLDWFMEGSARPAAPPAQAHRPDMAGLYASHSGKAAAAREGHLREYDRLLSPIRDNNVAVLALGVGNGGALEILATYFPRAASIVGVDADPNCARLQFDDPRILVITGDLSTPETRTLIRRASPKYDVVIDDGSHGPRALVDAFARNFVHIADGGLFIAEDIHCSRWRGRAADGADTDVAAEFFTMLAGMADQRHGSASEPVRQALGKWLHGLGTGMPAETLDQLHSVEFVNSMCIIRSAEPSANVIGARVVAGDIATVDPGFAQIAEPPPAATLQRPRRQNLSPPLLVRLAYRLDHRLAPLKPLLSRLRGRK